MFEFVIYECITYSDILITNKCWKYHFPLVRITTNVVSSNPAHGEVYSIQNYVIRRVWRYQRGNKNP